MSSTPLPLPRSCQLHHGALGQSWAPSWPPNYLWCKSVLLKGFVQEVLHQVDNPQALTHQCHRNTVLAPPSPSDVPPTHLSANWMAMLWTCPILRPSEASTLGRNNLKISWPFTWTDQRREIQGDLNHMVKIPQEWGLLGLEKQEPGGCHSALEFRPQLGLLWGEVKQTWQLKRQLLPEMWATRWHTGDVTFQSYSEIML